MATSTAASSATATSTVTGTTASSSVEQTPPAKEVLHIVQLYPSCTLYIVKPLGL